MASNEECRGVFPSQLSVRLIHTKSINTALSASLDWDLSMKLTMMSWSHLTRACWHFLSHQKRSFATCDASSAMVCEATKVSTKRSTMHDNAALAKGALLCTRTWRTTKA